MRLLLVEDDSILGNGIEAGLKQAGFTVDWARDGRSAQIALGTTIYELMVLDLGLPRVTGLDLLRQLRARGNDLPVLVLTARDTVRDRTKKSRATQLKCISTTCLKSSFAARATRTRRARCTPSGRSWPDSCGLHGATRRRGWPEGNRVRTRGRVSLRPERRSGDADSTARQPA